jgi:Protein of unknown function (DUF2569)
MQGELSNPAANPQPKLYGVGGWLAFFCVSLTIFAPIVHLKIAAKAFKNLMYPGHLAQSTLLRLDAVFVIYAGLAIFSCVCGYMLWSENPRGPGVTKAYLVIAAAVVIVLYSVLALAGMKIDLFTIVLGRLVYTVCWYAYLSTSVRVRLTYGVAQPTS